MSGSSSTTTPFGTLLAGRYRLERRIGIGGMAEVFAAHDTELDRRVAIKWLKPSLANDEIVAERFRREATAAAGLNHPNIVTVHDVCEHEGRQAVVMQLVDGKSLRKLLDGQKRLGPELTIHIGAGIAAALDEAHRAKLVHRDVKPGNILVTSDGRVLLTDFGIAKALRTSESDLTLENVMMGTVKYLSPEQVKGNPLDGRADLYSLGIVLYECLAGRVPFLGETDADTALARLQRDPTDLGHLRTTLPIGLVNLIHKTLARNPQHRPQTGAQLRAALLAVDSEPPTIDATPNEPPQQRRHARGAGPGIPGDPHMSGQLPRTAVTPSKIDRHPKRTIETPQVGSSGDTAVAESAPRGDRTPPANRPIHGHPSKRNEQQTGPALIALIALIAVALVVAVIVIVVNSRGDRAVDITDKTVVPTSLPSLDQTGDGTTQPSGAANVGLTATGTFDPDGDNRRENDDQAAAALADASTTTFWFTECYQNEYMGGKSGVGLTLKLPQLATGQVSFEVGTAPYQVQVFSSAAAQQPSTLSEWTAVDDVVSANQPGTVTARVDQEAQYLLVWFTQFGRDDVCSTANPYRGTIGELTFST